MVNTTTFLVARTETLDLGLEAAWVSRIVLRTDWEGPDPTDIEQLFRREPAERGCGRVLVMHGIRGPYTLGTTRDLVLRQCPISEIHDLPAVIWEPGIHPILRGISLLSNAPPLLVLDRHVLEARLASQPLQGEPL